MFEIPIWHNLIFVSCVFAATWFLLLRPILMEADVMDWKFTLVFFGVFGFSIIGFVVFVIYLCKGLNFLINFLGGIA
jgi:hypothetical protein